MVVVVVLAMAAAQKVAQVSLGRCRQHIRYEHILEYD